ncbi:MAG: bifunctional tRNA (5-methylaminomethyl-2-thiouridine)(34)-methyltransferase MnmD/FAD-dependent 5-carboxymethylaminomethyl-2-thiouridine(34) oxidoreductase MnmC [Congregibacter sp.]
MIRSLGPVAPMAAPGLEWTARGDPRSLRHADTYYSAAGGQQESQHVFVDGSELKHACADTKQDVLRVAELGFGTGLNFLLTWACFRQYAPADKRLTYWGVDRHPLRSEDLRRALQAFPELESLASQFLMQYPIAYPGIHRCILDDGRVRLDLVWADAEDAVEELEYAAPESIDIWYLDGFAPSRNPSMWQPQLFESIARISKPGTRLASYTAAGHVRRGLQNVGFRLRKREGFGNKRECINGFLEHRASPAKAKSTAWEKPPAQSARAVTTCGRNARKSTEPSVLVLGAGLAGAHVAHALAARDIPVQVLDAGSAAGRASGNAQGILFTRVYPERGLIADFSAFACMHASRFYDQCFHQGLLQRGDDGELNGCFQALPEKKFSDLARILKPFPELAECLTADQASQRLGARVSDPGIWQAHSGWLSPPKVVKALLANQRIELIEDCGVLRLQKNPSEGWEAVNARGEVISRASNAIIACGTATREFEQTAHLPTKAVRGQTTTLPASLGIHLQGSYCHSGYIAPAAAGEHCIGATFSPGDTDRSLRSEDHALNLQRLASALPEFETALLDLDPGKLEGRAELRCTSPDYLPMAGPAPRAQEFVAHFSELGKDAKRLIEEPGAFYDGLYVCTAFGSRGLSYACLSGELVASMICGETPPLSRELVRALSPARFLIRRITRGQNSAHKKETRG